MRSVTRKTLPLGIGCMGMFEFFRQFFMATETGFRQLVPQKSCSAAGMRLMTGQTLTRAHRLMHRPLTEGFFFLLMTAIAKFGTLFIQKSLEMGDMRIVASAALPGSEGLMNNFIGKLFFLMTLEADVFRCGMTRKKKGSKPENNQNTEMRYHYFPPSPG